jgi:hypothetical protein
VTLTVATASFLRRAKHEHRNSTTYYLQLENSAIRSGISGFFTPSNVVRPQAWPVRR